MFPAAIARQLRARGNDTVSIHDMDYRWLEGLPDQEVFRIAVAEGRAIVTENVPDFRRLEADALARGESRPALIFTTDRQFPRGKPSTVGKLVLALSAPLNKQPDASATMFLKPAIRRRR